MNEYTDLEINIRRRASDQFGVELSATEPGNDAEVRFAQKEPATARFDENAFRQLVAEPDEYGRLLTKTLFVDSGIADAFREEFNKSQANNNALRVRLLIDATAPELHNLRWELLRNPLDDSPLLTSERIAFSRYLISQDPRPVRPRARAELAAVIAIANPKNLSKYSVNGATLDPLEVDTELTLAQNALHGVTTKPLASGGQATLSQIIALLRDGADILYLVAHGAMSNNEPQLWLEDENGDAEVVMGREFVRRIKELGQLPQLIILASCQSAGRAAGMSDTHGAALTALGPLLAEAGAPAVVAMQGNVSMETVNKFMPMFLQQLLKHGFIDRAVATARGEVRDAHDAWMPVLFMRLRSGLLWYTPGFADDPNFRKWPTIIRSIHRNTEKDEEGEVQLGCTPILGRGLLEPYFGSPRQVARQWAMEHGFPLSADAREDLPQVAQYLSRHQDEAFPREELRRHMRHEIQHRFEAHLTPDLLQSDVTLAALTGAVGKHLRGQQETEPHRVLAQLPFQIYITTNPDDMLSDALREQNKAPRSAICPWNADLETKPEWYKLPDDYRPSVQEPLVYHLFGRFKYPQSIVLTEDNYFDYLIGMTSNNTRLPSFVRRAFTDSALLFLGFQLDEWSFRVLFRSIINRGGAPKLSSYTHVAVQLDPDENRNVNPGQARHYLELYFQKPDLSVFWGSVSDFTRQLSGQWKLQIEKEESPIAHPTGTPVVTPFTSPAPLVVSTAASIVSPEPQP